MNTYVFVQLTKVFIDPSNAVEHKLHVSGEPSGSDGITTKVIAPSLKAALTRLLSDEATENAIVLAIIVNGTPYKRNGFTPFLGYDTPEGLIEVLENI